MKRQTRWFLAAAFLPISAFGGVVQLFSPAQVGLVTGTQTPPAGGVTLQYTGDEGTVFSSPYVLSQYGIVLTFTQQGQPTGSHLFRRVNEVGSDGTTFSGDFLPNTRLLYTSGADLGGLGPVTISSNVGITEVAFQAQNYLYGPELFTISAFNGAVPLGSFNYTGLSGSRGDGSAVYLGLQTTGSDVITQLVVSSNTSDFALGPIDPPVSTAPEPATFATTASLLLAGGWLLRKKLSVIGGAQ